MTKVTLEVGMLIKHDCKASARYGAQGIVVATPRTPGTGAIRFVVAWFKGGNLDVGDTSLAAYKSNWIENNCLIVGRPVSNDGTLPAQVFREQFKQAANAVAEGPYMVSLEGGKAPSQEHLSLTAAKIEAERLSKVQQGRTATILAVVAKVKQKTVTSLETVWLKE
ncbi:hypothetical protein QLL94_gp16 [Pectobacterium phage PP2]|uniref:Uncharacterized protein n=1 Tax=Pectobacterium phage PP2 TaxID=1897743 RepID=A0A1W5P500_9CAUD|nr:hypothetical protein QLL94_gp16 [Pectobacterium phage PP2]AOT25382.1 hypothetical protein PP2_016 [Pectobacterium phage PP2]